MTSKDFFVGKLLVLRTEQGSLVAAGGASPTAKRLPSSSRIFTEIGAPGARICARRSMNTHEKRVNTGITILPELRDALIPCRAPGDVEAGERPLRRIDADWKPHA